MNKRKFLQPVKIQNPGANASMISVESDASMEHSPN